jgi:hypothetical protein
MRVIGIIATGVVAAIGVAAIVTGAMSTSDIKRYLRMRSM